MMIDINTDVLTNLQNQKE